MKLTNSQYRCTDCGRTFAGAHSFGRHRTSQYAPGQRICLAAADLRAIGMSPNPAGCWASERSAWAADAYATESDHHAQKQELAT